MIAFEDKPDDGSGDFRVRYWHDPEQVGEPTFSGTASDIGMGMAPYIPFRLIEDFRKSFKDKKQERDFTDTDAGRRVTLSYPEERVAGASFHLEKQATASELTRDLQRMCARVVLGPNAKEPTTLPPTTTGEVIRLGNGEDRLTLLHFWATWAQDNSDFFDEVAEAYRAHSANPRFRAVSICLDGDEDAARRFLAEQSPDWPQVIAGKDKIGLAKAYQVPSLPYAITHSSGRFSGTGTGSSVGFSCDFHGENPQYTAGQLTERMGAELMLLEEREKAGGVFLADLTSRTREMIRQVPALGCSWEYAGLDLPVPPPPPPPRGPANSSVTPAPRPTPAPTPGPIAGGKLTGAKLDNMRKLLLSESTYHQFNEHPIEEDFSGYGIRLKAQDNDGTISIFLAGDYLDISRDSGKEVGDSDGSYILNKRSAEHIRKLVTEVLPPEPKVH